MWTAPVGCSADSVDIDGISVAGGTVTINFSSDPNARFRCRLNNQRNGRLRPCECICLTAHVYWCDQPCTII